MPPIPRIHHPWLWLLAFRFVASVQLPQTRNNSIGQTEGLSRIAMLITGLEDRFIWESKMSRLIVPVLNQGYGIDVYIRLVASGKQDSSPWKTGEGRENSHEFDENRLRADISQSGARLMSLEVMEKSEDVYLPPLGSWPGQEEVMYEYSPFKTPVGVNVIRRYLSWSVLLEKLERIERIEDFAYTWVLVTRDDDYWLRNLRLSEFVQHESIVYSKNCKYYHGINDKTLLFGRNAARVVIQAYVHRWWKQGRIKNAEQLLMSITNSTGVVSHPVPFGQLPTSDAMYEHAGEGVALTMCLRQRYLCDAGFEYTERPPTCQREGWNRAVPDSTAS